MLKQLKEKFINIVVIIAVITSLLYIITRVALFLIAAYSITEKIFAALLIFAEFFILIHSIGYTINIFKAFVRKRKDVEKQEPLLSDLPAVAILVAARHEPKEILQNTFSAINALHYQNKQVFFLDDSSEEKYKREAEELSQLLNLTLFRRDDRHGAKAGIINDCIKNLPHKYVVIFDADQNPLPQFLDRLIPIMEKDDELAFIQTPQFYSNIEESRVAKAATFQQAVFYEYISEGKGKSDAMSCCGTNVIFRLNALKEVDGFDESSVTEDFATSVKLHMKGWKSLFYPHTYTFGMGPENLEEYFKQQFRWASGTITMFKRLIWKFIRNPFSLSASQWWEYFLSSSYYFVGITFFILMICPITYILFRIPTFFVNPEVYVLAFMPYIILSISVFYMGMGIRHYKAKNLFSGQMLGIITFSVYMHAAFLSLSGAKTTFKITSKEKGKALPILRLWPQLAMLLLNFIAIVWALNRFYYEWQPAILVNGFWAFYHFLALCGIFYFNEEDIYKIKSKKLHRKAAFSYTIVDVQNIHGLDKTTWRTCFTVFVPEHMTIGTKLMCKIKRQDNKSIIFDGMVVWSSEKKSRKGFKTSIGVLTASKSTRDELKEVIK